MCPDFKAVGLRISKEPLRPSRDRTEDTVTAFTSIVRRIHVNSTVFVERILVRAECADWVLTLDFPSGIGLCSLYIDENGPNATKWRGLKL
jgi:hypothetical protein